MITTRKYSVSLRKLKKYTDPRILQIDLDADWVNTSAHPDKGIHSDRVMPLADFGKFCKTLRRKTKAIQEIDGSHFWVSGYYALHFYLKSKKDRMKMKKLVHEAIKESGGFMPFDEWYEKHNAKHPVFMMFAGSGSGIRQITNTTPYAFR